MRLLKLVLYVVLSLCLMWGVAITLGPTIIAFVLSRSFGEQQIRLSGLSISPKLQISASRAEFDFRNSGQSLYGTVRAPKFKIAPTMDGWVAQVSSGLLELNDTFNLPALKLDFHSTSIKNISTGHFIFSSTEFASEKDVEFSGINVSADVDFSSSVLRNLTFSAKTGTITFTQTGAAVLFDVIAGDLVEFFLHQPWQTQSLDFELSAEKFKVQSDQLSEVNLGLFSLEAESQGYVVDGALMAESLSVPDNNIYLEGIRVKPSFDFNTLKFQKEMPVQIDYGHFEQNKPNKMSGKIMDLEAIVGLHFPERFLRVVSDVTDLEIWNEQFPLITIPKMEIDVQASLSAVAQFQYASSVFKAKINGEGGSEVMGDLAFQMSNEEGHDCLTAYCVASHLLFDGKYDYEGENVIGKGSCSAVDCGAETFALTVVTSNTPKVISGLTKQKIINPFALVMIAGGMLQGQEVGLGHKIQF